MSHALVVSDSADFQGLVHALAGHHNQLTLRVDGKAPVAGVADGSVGHLDLEEPVAVDHQVRGVARRGGGPGRACPWTGFHKRHAQGNRAGGFGQGQDREPGGGDGRRGQRRRKSALRCL